VIGDISNYESIVALRSGISVCCFYCSGLLVYVVVVDVQTWSEQRGTGIRSSLLDRR